jgi:hypothetical protein
LEFGFCMFLTEGWCKVSISTSDALFRVIKGVLDKSYEEDILFSSSILSSLTLLFLSVDLTGDKLSPS